MDETLSRKGRDGDYEGNVEGGKEGTTEGG